MKDKFEILCWLKRAYRQGLYFEKSLRMLEQSQQFNAAALTKYQNERLRRMVHHCYREVPYYQDLFSRLKLKPDDIQTQADLRKLPMMDKPTVNANFDKLIAKSG